MRFPAACLASAALALAAPALAQSGAAPAAAPAAARVVDIQLAREGDTLSILVKLSHQPSAASTKTSGHSLTLVIDGINLAPLTLTPPAGSMVAGVKAGAGTLTLTGAAFSSASTVIYRNAVLIEAKLAEPNLRSGSSLMADISASRLATASAPAPPPSAPAAPSTLTANAQSLPAALTPAGPNAPILLPAPGSTPARTTGDLNLHPAPPAENPARAAAATLAGIDATRCSNAASELARDAWALTAMGDQALCLIDAGQFEEAKGRLDQLAAITPRDWRIALGRAALAQHAGESEKAQAEYQAAAEAAPDAAIRAAIEASFLTHTAQISASAPGEPAP